MSVSDKRVRTKRETNDSFRKNNKPDAAGKGNSGDTEKETGKKKQSARQVWNNQIYLWKLCFKTCPGYMLYFLYDGFRYQGIIFRRLFW